MGSFLRAEAIPSSPWVIEKGPIAELIHACHQEWDVEANEVSFSNEASTAGGGIDLPDKQ